MSTPASAPATPPTPPVAPATSNAQKHPVDQVPPAGKLVVLSVQHLLAFYAGAVVVPLLIAGQLNLDAKTTIHLINADLFTCGIATLIQSVGFWKVGVRLPIIQGVTTTAVAPIVAIGLAVNSDGGVGVLPAIYGSIIISGIFTFLAAPYFAKFIRFFPPVVIGTVLATMGLTLLSVAANDFTNYSEGTPETKDLAYAGLTLAIIIVMQRFFKGFLGTLSILVGLVIGTAVAFGFGDAGFDDVGTSDWVGFTTPFYFGAPEFVLTGAISMIIVMLITMVESTGDVFAAGEIVGRRTTKDDIARALRADGLSTTLGGVMNSFPYTCFAQNVGLVRMTRVRSRWVVAAAGVLMIVIGLIPKAGAVVSAIPSPVLGAASMALFANVALVGIQTLGKVDLTDTRNATILTISIGLGMLVTFKPGIAEVFPDWAQVFFASGVTTGSIAAIVLNLLFFHVGRRPSPDVTRDAAGRMLTLEDVNAMDQASFLRTFSPLFNNATWPLERAHAVGPFATVQDLRDAVQDAVLTAPREQQDALIRDYPSMAELLLDAEALKRESGFAGSLALEEMDDVEQEQLRDLSDQYHQRFSMPFVACLGRMDSRSQIVTEGLRRLENSPEQEHLQLLGEVVEISNDRFNNLIADANPVAAAWESKFDHLG
ncbi:MAG: solute carrier family 23 protein [Corynebacterium variabile]|uniref:solute carrier family 23 protein n=1 Tax=Corynebacterium variabile TaxID=1727 RepID=UPI00264840E9|nr:solute carrier family 23 protein [Corynebacterium variabile]MDN6241233.1 purine/pyrimidine permease [Corynebacterium variabile]MDN6478021.1 purine/pyrimidine permease [Corynebacterium variabile]